MKSPKHARRRTVSNLCKSHIPERNVEMPVLAYLLVFLLLSALLTWLRIVAFRRRYRG
jgi:putative exporter of polyketide antibiotics